MTEPSEFDNLIFPDLLFPDPTAFTPLAIEFVRLLFVHGASSVRLAHCKTLLQTSMVSASFAEISGTRVSVRQRW
jgi:hypothetical protein